MARGQQHDRKPRLRPREDRRALAPDGVEHRHQPVGPGLHRRTDVDRHRVGASAPKEIGQDEAAERGQPAQVARHRGLVPQQVDRERRGGTKSRSGPPSPTIWYARWASPSRAYSVAGAMTRAWHGQCRLNRRQTLRGVSVQARRARRRRLPGQGSHRLARSEGTRASEVGRSGRRSTRRRTRCAYGTLSSELAKQAEGSDPLAVPLIQIPLDWAEQQFRAIGRATRTTWRSSCLSPTRAAHFSPTRWGKPSSWAAKPAASRNGSTHCAHERVGTATPLA